MNSADFASAAGLSFRQLDHWTRRCYLHPARRHPGLGTRREWSAVELGVARRMVRLVNAGLCPESAAWVARRPYDEVELGPGITLTIRGVTPRPLLTGGLPWAGDATAELHPEESS